MLCIFKIRDANAFIGVMETQVEQVTLEILREMEILCDIEGKYIFHLWRMYVSALVGENASLSTKRGQ